MSDAYVIEVSGRIAGIVARDSQNNSFNFYSAVPRFNAIEGQRFSDPLAAERAARMLRNTGASHDTANRNEDSASRRGRRVPVSQQRDLQALDRFAKAKSDFVRARFRFQSTHYLSIV
jgi:hypothetical protein